MRHLPGRIVIAAVIATITLGLARPGAFDDQAADAATPVKIQTELEIIGQALRLAIVNEASAEASLDAAKSAAVDAQRAVTSATDAAKTASLVARQSSAYLDKASAERKRLEVAYQKALEAGEPQPPDPPTADPWTFAFAEMTLEQAKVAAASRVTLPDPGTRTDAGHDVVFKDLQYVGDNGFLKDETRANKWGRTYGVNKYVDAEGFPIPRTTWLKLDNLQALPPIVDPGENPPWKWFWRASNIPRLEVSRCAVIGTTFNGRQTPIEHAFYFDVSGDTLFTDCLFMYLGGHPWYITNRAEPFQQYGRISLYYSAKATHRCVNVIAIDCEQDAARGAFDFTSYDPGSYEFPGTVILEDCASIMAWDYQRSQGTNERHPIEPYRQGEVRSCGAMVVTNYVYTGQEGWPTEQITLDGVVFWTVQGRHALASLRGSENYLFRDCFFKTEDHANPFIEVGSKRGNAGFRAPAEVVIENCMDQDADLKIWTSASEFEVFDINSTIGKRWTWTPSGTTLEVIQ